MELTVGKKSVIARNLNNLLGIIFSIAIIYSYLKYYMYVVEKYNRTISDVWMSDYKAEFIDQFIFIFGIMASVIFSVVLIWNITEIIIGVHYFKRTKTNIGKVFISQTNYIFPFSSNKRVVVVDDISDVTTHQSSVQRLLGCGNVRIKGYSNSNYSKTNFSITIHGIDNVEKVKDEIVLILKK